jgi:hypothetical protein
MPALHLPGAAVRRTAHLRDGGSAGAIVSAIASLQTADALKMLAGRADLVRPLITTVDVGEPHPASGDAAARPQCPACGRGEFPWLERKERAPLRLCGRDAVQIHESARAIDLAELRARLEPLGEVRANEWALRFRAPPYEMTVFPDGRAIVKGTADPGAARAFYARYRGCRTAGGRTVTGSGARAFKTFSTAAASLAPCSFQYTADRPIPKRRASPAAIAATRTARFGHARISEYASTPPRTGMTIEHNEVDLMMARQAQRLPPVFGRRRGVRAFRGQLW